MAREKLKGTVRICVVCGREYEPTYKGQQCCGKECARKKEAETKHKPRTHYCLHCGKLITRRKKDHKDKLLYCSRECAFAEKRAKPKPKVKPVCVVCGKEFEGRANAKYCSHGCRKEKAREDYRGKYFVSVKETNPMIEKQCEHCGKPFQVNYYASRRKYCSKQCSEAAYYERHPEQRREQMRRRRARLKGARVELVKPEEIYERDGWRCQICGKRVNPRLRYPHPMSATLDHIIPLAEGGTHEPKNVQLAHFICNSKKGAGGCDQLRLLG